MSIRSDIVWIDAAYARHAMASMKINRRASRRTVACYMRDMLAGNFVLNGEGVVFDNTGALVDGQHRFLAVIAADNIKPGFRVQMLVVTGVESGCRYDVGRVRTVADQYTMDGGKDATKVMAITRTIRSWSDTDGLVHARMNGDKPTYDELIDTLTEDASILRACQHGGRMRMLYSDHAFTFIRWLFYRVPGASEWFDAMCDGVGLTEGSPALIVRNFLIRNRLSLNAAGVSQRVRDIITPAAVTIKAWNAHVERKKITGMRWTEAEKFPIPHGLST